MLSNVFGRGREVLEWYARIFQGKGSLIVHFSLSHIKIRGKNYCECQWLLMRFLTFVDLSRLPCSILHSPIPGRDGQFP